MNKHQIVRRYWSYRLDAMTVKDARKAFEDIYEWIEVDCADIGLDSPGRHEAFGIWCGV